LLVLELLSAEADLAANDASQSGEAAAQEPKAGGLGNFSHLIQGGIAHLALGAAGDD
jgi:hypothetical protein